MVLGNVNSSVMIAVRDIHAACDFYGNVLGLEQVGNRNGVAIFRTGGTLLCIYPSEFAGSNKANAAVWIAGDHFDAIVQELSAKGVTFEHYEFPDVTFDGRVHREGDLAFAWFKDPYGNILEINNG